MEILKHKFSCSKFACNLLIDDLKLMLTDELKCVGGGPYVWYFIVVDTDIKITSMNKCLDSIERGFKLQNQSNNRVNAYAIFDVLNQKGKDYFHNYYSGMFQDEIDIKEFKRQQLQKQIDELNNDIDAINNFIK